MVILKISFTNIENNSIVSNKKCSTTIEIDPIREIRLDEESRVDHKFFYGGWFCYLCEMGGTLKFGNRI